MCLDSFFENRKRPDDESVKEPKSVENKQSAISRKYQDSDLKYRFIVAGNWNAPSPCCLICGDIYYTYMSNEAMKPSKLLQHVEALFMFVLIPVKSAVHPAPTPSHRSVKILPYMKPVFVAKKVGDCCFPGIVSFLLKHPLSSPGSLYLKKCIQWKHGCIQENFNLRVIGFAGVGWSIRACQVVKLFEWVVAQSACTNTGWPVISPSQTGMFGTCTAKVCKVPHMEEKLNYHPGTTRH